MFFMSTWWVITKIRFRFIYHCSLLKTDQNRAKKGWQMGWIGCAILQVPQWAIVRFQFLAYFWNPLIKSGNALALVQWVHKPVDIWDITRHYVLYWQIVRPLVILNPADFEAHSSVLPHIQIPNACLFWSGHEKCCQMLKIFFCGIPLLHKHTTYEVLVVAWCHNDVTIF